LAAAGPWQHTPERKPGAFEFYKNNAFQPLAMSIERIADATLARSAALGRATGVLSLLQARNTTV
jgi:hypothetical protein